VAVGFRFRARTGGAAAVDVDGCSLVDALVICVDFIGMGSISGV
jgi:hypothetical protein